MTIQTPSVTQRMRVGSYDEASDVLLSLGTLELGPRGRLRLIDAKPGYQALLSRLVDEVNARDTLLLKVPPPPGDAPPLGVYHRSVTRDAPDLPDRLAEYVEQRYDLLLIPG